MRVGLDAGESRRVGVPVELRDLASYGADGWRLGSRRWTLRIGASSRDEDLLTVRIDLPERSWSIQER